MRAIVRRVVTFCVFACCGVQCLREHEQATFCPPEPQIWSDCVQALIAESHVTADDFRLICRSTQQIAATFEVRPCAQLCGES